MSLIDQRDLTTGEVEGSGLFDELMRTTKAHLEAEIRDGRLTDAGYAQIYLGAMQSNLQAAMQFTLQKEINSQQALLLQEQLRQAVKQTALLAEQITKAKDDNTINQYVKDVLQLDQHNLQLEQIKLVQAQTGQATAQAGLAGIQGLTATADSGAKVSLQGKQGDLVTQQMATEKSKIMQPVFELSLIHI